jgi:hypothetical protein
MLYKGVIMLSYIEQKFQKWLNDIKENYAYILSSPEVAARNAFEAGNNTPKECPIKENKRIINWTAFKKSGKWYASGIAFVNLKDNYFNSQDLLNDIDKSQQELVKSAISCGQFNIYVDDLYDLKNNENYPFITRLILAKE